MVPTAGTHSNPTTRMAKSVRGCIYMVVARIFTHLRTAGTPFKLIRQPRRIELVRGRTHDAVEQTKDFMRDHADFYRYGDVWRR